MNLDRRARQMGLRYGNGGSLEESVFRRRYSGNQAGRTCIGEKVYCSMKQMTSAHPLANGYAINSSFRGPVTSRC